MTNSPELAKIPKGTCSDDDKGGRRPRRHRIHLVNGRAKMARMYPPKFAQAIIRGIKKQMDVDGELREVDFIEAGTSSGEDPKLEDYEKD